MKLHFESVTKSPVELAMAAELRLAKTGKVLKLIASHRLGALKLMSLLVCVQSNIKMI